MKKIALFSILLGGIMLIGCSKPSTKATPTTTTLPPVSAPVAASAGGGGDTGAAASAPTERPTIKDGPQPIAEQPAVQSVGID